MIRKKNALLGVILVLLCLAGCTQLPPKYMSESFDIQQVDRIAVLPFIDNRAKTNPEHDFELMCNNATDKILKRFMTKGYAASSSGDVGAVSSYTAQDLPKPFPNSKDTDSVDPDSVDIEWIKNLGPSSARWVFVPVFDELSTDFLVIGFEANTKISTYLFDKKIGELSWKNDSEGTMSVGILSAPFYTAIAGRQGLLKDAVNNAAWNCMGRLPKR